jgi:hypothetical protein
MDPVLLHEAGVISEYLIPKKEEGTSSFGEQLHVARYAVAMTPYSS